MAEPRITLEQVRHVARLARLELTPEEEQSLQANMSEILAYVDKLNELDTSTIEPTTQVGEAGTPMRDDEVTNHPSPRPCCATRLRGSITFSRFRAFLNKTASRHLASYAI